MKEYVLGIDLGTTNSCVAIYENKKTRLIEIEGKNTMPSVVCYKSESDVIVGKAANNQKLNNPKNTIFGAKRLMGNKIDSDVVTDIKKNSPYSIVAGKNDQAYIEVLGKVKSPEEVSSQILRKIVAQAEEVLGRKVTKVVITVPAYFNDAQRTATKNAGKIAGLDVLRIINEPTAAALAYGMDLEGKEKNIAVYDFGGGTFDISILSIHEKVFEVKATNGDTNLGGEKIDEKVMDYILGDFKGQHGIDLRQDSMALQRVKEVAEKAKIDLSSQDMAEINLPFISQQSGGAPVHYTAQLSKTKFEQMIEDIINDTLKPCKKCLEDAGNLRIDEVILVGGSTKIPLVRKKVEEVFNKKPNHSVNPDEAVAIGAAIQGAVLSGDVNDMVLLDVTPLTLGIETMGGVSTPLIPRNSSIPTKKSQVFSTAVDNQPSVTIHVTQGERAQAGDNKSLGRFDLSGISSAPRGVPQIEVTFDIDTNGILNISAVDKATGKKNNITIQANDGLSEDEIEKMQKDGEKYAEEDKKKKELIEAKNTADNIIYTVEKNINNAGDEEAKKNAENLLKELKDAVAADDLNKIKSITAQLQQIASKLTPKQEPPKQEASDDKTDKDNKSDASAKEANFKEVDNEGEKK